MAPEKKKISLLDEGKVALPQELIPEGVTLFECEQSEDGRIILTPISAHSNASLDSGQLKEGERSEGKTARIIDFQTSRAFKRKHRTRKSSQHLPIPQNSLLEGQGEFVQLHLFASRLEAEMLGEILRQSEIPYLIQSEDIGLFGPGVSSAPGGARLVVRKCYLENARNLLLGLIELP